MQPTKTSAKQSVFDFPLWGSECSLIVAVTQWEVEVGKYYEPILTTRDGLWRYRLGDVLYIVGFVPGGKLPIFNHSGRRWSVYYHSYAPYMTSDDSLGQVDDSPLAYAGRRLSAPGSYSGV